MLEDQFRGKIVRVLGVCRSSKSATKVRLQRTMTNGKPRSEIPFHESHVNGTEAENYVQTLLLSIENAGLPVRNVPKPKRKMIDVGSEPKARMCSS